MSPSGDLRPQLLGGALAGLSGGLVLALPLSELDQMISIAGLVRADSPLTGFVVVMVVAALLGAGFGLLVWAQRPGAGETLFWGLLYGAFWWYLGPLTLLPLFRGEGLSWYMSSAQAEFPLLIALALYGAVSAMAFVFYQWNRYYPAEVQTRHLYFGAPITGSAAGLISAALLGLASNAQGELLAFGGTMLSESRLVAWLVVLLIGLVAGGGFGLLHPRPADGSGAGLVRGSVYGLLWWMVGGLTLVPLIGGAGLTWSAEEVRGLFVTLPGYTLFGAGIGLFYQWLSALVRLFFSDYIGDRGDEGVGTEGLRIVGRSVVGGIVGGLIFSQLMLQIGFLPSVAELIRATSPITGFFVHLVIAMLVGTSYGLLFRRQSYDLASALGWGVSYGFFWWILGPLTLMPIFLGTTPQWTVEAASTAFPNLIGHLGYGGGLGITFYLLEAGYRPWWIPHTQLEAARVARRKEQVLTSAPAPWTLLVAIGLTLPVLLGS